MSIDKTYFDYLDHFGATRPVRALHRYPDSPGIALRHDVDDDLGTALEMAYWERERGCRSTYFLLHTAQYWSDPRLPEIALQIQDFGHEVGLHLNALGEWATGRTEDITGAIAGPLMRLREAGVEVSGVSAHGDPACYVYGFSNYWCFRELRPDDPATESGLSAEGIPVVDPAFRLKYPPRGEIRRDDGSIFSLWSISMIDLGLHYDAVHVAHDSYYTDTGGGWIRSDDPLRHDLSRGRHQILVHPQHWKARPQIYFFLSTARSGSKWLARVVDAATPLRGDHEFTLNHRYVEGGCIPEKRTGDAFVELIADRSEVASLMKEARSCIEEKDEDYGEANVYLVHVLQELKEVFPDAHLVHLHRDPRAVVRSIVARGWYDTPRDDRHPPVDVEGWLGLPPFDKACWYVRDVALTLLAEDLPRLRLEEVAQPPERLAERLRDVGIPFYPRLARGVAKAVVDPTPARDLHEWSLGQKIRFHRICGEALGRMGYSSRLVERVWSVLRPLANARPRRRDGAPLTLATGRPDTERIATRACRLEPDNGHIRCVPEGDRHAHVLLGGATWTQAPSDAGWPATVAVYYAGRIELSLRGGTGTLFALMYGESGSQIAKRSLVSLSPSRDSYDFSFRTKPHATRFDLAVYLPVQDLPEEILIAELRLEQLPLGP